MKSIFFLIMISSSGFTNNKYIIYPSENIGNKNWIAINDDVMGGISNSSVIVNENKNLIFTGNISFENNGGFSSCRMFVDFENFFDFESFMLKIKGDGKIYKLVLRTMNSPIYYSVNFKTKEYEWITKKINISEFKPFYRGRKIMESTQFKLNDIKYIGFQISDKQEGPFSLEVLSVITYNSK